MERTTFSVRVDSVRDEAHGVRSFSVSRLDGQPFERYEPGAHIDVTGPSGVTRQYSLCGDPDHRETHLFAVKREEASRGGSRSLHEDVTVGCELTIGAPRNLFQLAPGATEHILIAAGIGVTPLLSMAYRLLKQEQRFVLHYFARSAEHAAFLPLLSRAPFNDFVRFHFGVARDQLDAALAGCVADARDGSHLYTCGPAPFMERVVAIGEQRVAADAIHLERFAAAPLLRLTTNRTRRVHSTCVLPAAAQRSMWVSTRRSSRRLRRSALKWIRHAVKASAAPAWSMW